MSTTTTTAGTYVVHDGVGQSHPFDTRLEAVRFAAVRKTFTWAQVHYVPAGQ